MNPIFLFDFGSPNAYLAHKVVPEIEARAGVRFRYLPVLLGGLFKLSGNQSPVVRFANAPKRLAYERLEMDRFTARHGLTAFRWNPHFPVNTLSLMRGAVAAEDEGVFERYVDLIFHYMWEDPRKLDDADTLAAALEEGGLPTKTLLTRTQEQPTKDKLVANTNFAFERGAFGVPTFLVGEEIYFGKDRLRDVEEAISGVA